MAPGDTSSLDIFLRLHCFSPGSAQHRFQGLSRGAEPANHPEPPVLTGAKPTQRVPHGPGPGHPCPSRACGTGQAENSPRNGCRANGTDGTARARCLSPEPKTQRSRSGERTAPGARELPQARGRAGRLREGRPPPRWRLWGGAPRPPRPPCPALPCPAPSRPPQRSAASRGSWRAGGPVLHFPWRSAGRCSRSSARRWSGVGSGRARVAGAMRRRGAGQRAVPRVFVTEVKEEPSAKRERQNQRTIDWPELAGTHKDMESNCCPCTGHPTGHPVCLRTVSSLLLNTVRLGP
ncbi:uncharacterized protein [Patagioenas fasciata]|uniref:uncharacterized protein n=1 Tax=Patagioenas fasciata TaxID=372321 RepID=UPI003A9A65D3